MATALDTWYEEISAVLLPAWVSLLIQAETVLSSDMGRAFAGASHSIFDSFLGRKLQLVEAKYVMLCCAVLIYLMLFISCHFIRSLFFIAVCCQGR